MNQMERLLNRRPDARPVVIAHRGLSWVYPENTLVSYQAAADAQADLIELDFHRTADGVLACVHDPMLNRYLTVDAPAEWRERKIESFTWDELSQVDIGRWKGDAFSGTRIPRLEQVLERFVRPDGDGPILLIEQKTGSPEETLAILQRFNAVKRVIVQSFAWKYLAQLHALEPALVLAALGGNPFHDKTLEQVAATGARFVHWSDAVRQRDVAAAHMAGRSVWVYTLNSELAWRGACALGVDGFATDRCSTALAVVAHL